MGYQASASTATQPQVYDSSAAGYPQQSYAQSSAQYGQPATGYAGQESNYYVAGADMAVDQRSSTARIPVSQAQPRNVQYPTSNSAYASAPQDSRAMYYSQQAPSGVAVTSAQYSTQPTDPYYGRAVPPTGPEYSQDPYDSRAYQDSSVYSSIPVTAAASATPTTSSSSSRREREPEHRDRSDRHRRR